MGRVLRVGKGIGGWEGYWGCRKDIGGVGRVLGWEEYWGGKGIWVGKGIGGWEGYWGCRKGIGGVGRVLGWEEYWGGKGIWVGKGIGGWEGYWGCRKGIGGVGRVLGWEEYWGGKGIWVGKGIGGWEGYWGLGDGKGIGVGGVAIPDRKFRVQEYYRSVPLPSQIGYSGSLGYTAPVILMITHHCKGCAQVVEHDFESFYRQQYLKDIPRRPCHGISLLNTNIYKYINCVYSKIPKVAATVAHNHHALCHTTYSALKLTLGQRLEGK